MNPGPRPPTSPPTDLSPRQRQMLELAAQGYENAQIAALLGISRRTVQTRLYDAYRRLGVNNRTRAVLTAAERGEIDLRLRPR